MLFNFDCILCGLKVSRNVQVDQGTPSKMVLLPCKNRVATRVVRMSVCKQLLINSTTIDLSHISRLTTKMRCAVNLFTMKFAPGVYYSDNAVAYKEALN